jgi:hypothetical protein
MAVGYFWPHFNESTIIYAVSKHPDLTILVRSALLLVFIHGLIHKDITRDIKYGEKA